MLRPLLSFVVVLASACGPKGPATTVPDDDESVGPQTPSDPVEHAAQLIAKGEIDAADKVIADAMAQDPDNAELWFSQGVVAKERGDNDAAAQAWEHALTLAPDLVPARAGLGALALAAEAYADAQVHFEAALAANSEFVPAHYNLALALLGQGKLPEATASLQAAHRLDPEDVDVLIELSRVTAPLDPATALALAQRAATLAPNDAMARTTHGWLLARGGDHQAAAIEFEAAVAAAPSDSEARLGRARAWVRIGKVAEAAEEFGALTLEVPDAAQVWADWGAALAKLKKFDEAVAKLDQALVLDPKLTAAHLRKVAALAQAKQCKAAKQANRQLVRAGASPKAQAAAKSVLATCK